MFLFNAMQTEYHCPKCDVKFSEEKLPNINKIHKRCGSYAKIVRHIPEDKKVGGS